MVSGVGITAAGPLPIRLLLLTGFPIKPFGTWYKNIIGTGSEMSRKEHGGEGCGSYLNLFPHFGQKSIRMTSVVPVVGQVSSSSSILSISRHTQQDTFFSRGCVARNSFHSSSDSMLLTFFFSIYTPLNSNILYRLKRKTL